MKNLIILALLALLAISWANESEGPQPVIQDTTARLITKADIPAWKAPDPTDDMLFAPCPIDHRNVLKRHSERTA
jgi:hypothetical protein